MARMIYFASCLVSILFIASTSYAQLEYGYDIATGTFGYSQSLLPKPSWMARYNKAKDAGKNLNFFLRDEIGGGVILANAKLEQHFHENDPKTGEPLADSMFTKIISPRSAYYLVENTGYPLATLSEKAALIFSYGIGIRYISWRREDIYFRDSTVTNGITTLAFSAPLSLEYKSGGEAVLDRSKRNCFTVGAGVEAMVSNGSLALENASTEFHLYPFVKIEYGFVTRFACFKLRATGTAGHFSYFKAGNVKDGINSRYSEFALNGKSQFTFGLFIIPMVSKWEDAAWYR